MYPWRASSSKCRRRKKLRKESVNSRYSETRETAEPVRFIAAQKEGSKKEKKRKKKKKACRKCIPNARAFSLSLVSVCRVILREPTPAAPAPRHRTASSPIRCRRVQYSVFQTQEPIQHRARVSLSSWEPSRSLSPFPTKLQSRGERVEQVRLSYCSIARHHAAAVLQPQLITLFPVLQLQI